MVLPPNVNEADFNAALGQFRSAVGASWVFSSDEDVALYRDSYSINWGEPEERVASAAVAPAKVEEVQQIVRIANRTAFLCTRSQPDATSPTADLPPICAAASWWT